MQLQKKCSKNTGQLANRLALADREGMRLSLTWTVIGLAT